MRRSPTGQGKSPQLKCVALEQINQLGPMFLSPSPRHSLILPCMPDLSIDRLHRFIGCQPFHPKPWSSNTFWRVRQQATTPRLPRQAIPWADTRGSSPSSMPPKIGQSANSKRSNRSVNRSLLYAESSIFSVEPGSTHVFQKKSDHGLAIRRANG